MQRSLLEIYDVIIYVSPLKLIAQIISLNRNKLLYCSDRVPTLSWDLKGDYINHEPTAISMKKENFLMVCTLVVGNLILCYFKSNRP